MLTLFVAWVVFPLAVTGASIGCALAVEALVRVRFPGALLAPVGLATIVVVAERLGDTGWG